MSLSAFVLQVTCSSLAQVFPSMNAILGVAGGFWLFSTEYLAGFSAS